MSRKPFSAVCYDLHAVSRFFRSVALAIAFQKHITLTWETDRDSAVLNGIYKVMFWKEPPGTASVDFGSDLAILRTTDELHERYLLAWLTKLHTGGPGASLKYVKEMNYLRDVARDTVAEVLRDAASINAGVLSETQDAIVALSRIRLGATIGVAVIGGAVGVGYAAAALGGGAAGGLTMFGVAAGAPSIAFGGTSLIYSVTTSVINNWDAAPSAEVAGVSKEMGKGGGGELLSRGSEHLVERALKDTARSQNAVKSAIGLIDKFSEKLARDGLSRKAASKAARNLAHHQSQLAAKTAQLATAKTLGRVAGIAIHAVPVIFAAWDVIDGINDYRDTMQSAGR